jgi:hypothetical protein
MVNCNYHYKFKVNDCIYLFSKLQYLEWALGS